MLNSRYKVLNHILLCPPGIITKSIGLEHITGDLAFCIIRHDRNGYSSYHVFINLLDY